MNQAEPTLSTQAKPRKFGYRFTTLGFGVCAIGLLLWARFILVTNHPRTAIAEPSKAAVQPAEKPKSTPRKPAATVHVATPEAELGD